MEAEANLKHLHDPCQDLLCLAKSPGLFLRGFFGGKIWVGGGRRSVAHGALQNGLAPELRIQTKTLPLHGFHGTGELLAVNTTL